MVGLARAARALWYLKGSYIDNNGVHKKDFWSRCLPPHSCAKTARSEAWTYPAGGRHHGTTAPPVLPQRAAAACTVASAPRATNVLQQRHGALRQSRICDLWRWRGGPAAARGNPVPRSPFAAGPGRVAAASPRARLIGGRRCRHLSGKPSGSFSRTTQPMIPRARPARRLEGRRERARQRATTGDCSCNSARQRALYRSDGGG